MPIIDLQRRITERGRIRLGAKATTKTGKSYPTKSETFLLSSHDRTAVELAAAEYGGTVETFDAGYRTDTGRTELDVILPPSDMAFSQWMELWGNRVCHRRCDGVRETISDGPCLCDSDPRARECKTTTRLSVMLPDLPGFGLWRIESHGYYAATEIAGAVQAVTHLAPGTLVRARLVAEPREVVRFDRNGKPQTHKFVVPTLDLPDVRLRDLIAPAGVGVQIEAPTAAAPTPAAITPVPVAELPEGPRLSVADQIANQPEKPRRANAAAPLPSTGLEPGKLAGGVSATSPPAAPSPASFAGGGERDVHPPETVGEARPPASTSAPGGAKRKAESPPRLGSNAAAPGEVTQPPTPSGPDPDDDRAWFPAANRKARALASSCLSDDKETAEAQRQALIWAASGGVTVQSKELTRTQHQAMTQRLVDLSKGKATLVETNDPTFLGWTLAYEDAA